MLVACGDSSDEKETDTSNEKTETEETSCGSDQAQGTENEDAVYEIGETLEMESFEWDIMYDVTVHSVDFTREYGSHEITEFVINGNETDHFAVAKATVKNNSDEEYKVGEYISPIFGTDLDGTGEDFEFELSEESVSQDVAPGEEVEVEFVFIVTTAYLENPDDDFYLHFEGFTDNQKSYVVPTK